MGYVGLEDILGVIGFEILSYLVEVGLWAKGCFFYVRWEMIFLVSDKVGYGGFFGVRLVWRFGYTICFFFSVWKGDESVGG